MSRASGRSAVSVFAGPASAHALSSIHAAYAGWPAPWRLPLLRRGTVHQSPPQSPAASSGRSGSTGGGCDAGSSRAQSRPHFAHAPSGPTWCRSGLGRRCVLPCWRGLLRRAALLRLAALFRRLKSLLLALPREPHHRGGAHTVWPRPLPRASRPTHCCPPRSCRSIEIQQIFFSQHVIIWATVVGKGEEKEGRGRPEQLTSGRRTGAAGAQERVPALCCTLMLLGPWPWTL